MDIYAILRILFFSWYKRPLTVIMYVKLVHTPNRQDLMKKIVKKFRRQYQLLQNVRFFLRHYYVYGIKVLHETRFCTYFNATKI